MRIVTTLLAVLPFTALAGGSNYGVTPGTIANPTGKVSEWPVPTPRFARDPAIHTDGVGALNHFIYLGIVTAIEYVLHGEWRAAPSVHFAHKIQCAAYRGKHAEREHIHLQQAQRFEIILVPLNHAALRHGGVFDGYQTSQRALRNDESADMLRQKHIGVYHRICG